MLSPLPEEIKRYVSLSSHRYLTSPHVSVSTDVFFYQNTQGPKKDPPHCLLAKCDTVSIALKYFLNKI